MFLDDLELLYKVDEENIFQIFIFKYTERVKKKSILLSCIL